MPSFFEATCVSLVLLFSQQVTRVVSIYGEKKNLICMVLSKKVKSQLFHCQLNIERKGIDSKFSL